MLKRRFSKSRSGGFSIVELLIVIMVLGVLIAIAGLSMRGYQRQIQADVTATEVSQLIRLTRDRAITERATFRLILRKDPGEPGDTYTVEKWTYNAQTGTGVIAETRNYDLPVGWRFGKSAAAVTNPRGLVDIFGAATTTNLLFKGDDTVRGGNTGALIANPTLEVGSSPMNGTIFLYDANEQNPTVREYKPRSITMLGSTGRTAVWKLYPLGGGAYEWRSGTQVS